MEMLKKGWKLGFCLMSKGNRMVSVESRACLYGSEKRAVACFCVSGPSFSHLMKSSWVPTLQTKGTSTASPSALPCREPGSQKQGLHHTLRRLCDSGCIGKYTWSLTWVKLERNKWCSVMSVFTSQIVSLDVWSQKTRWIIFQTRRGWKWGWGLFWVFVSSAVLVLAIRGDKVLSS